MALRSAAMLLRVSRHVPAHRHGLLSAATRWSTTTSFMLSVIRNLQFVILLSVLSVSVVHPLPSVFLVSFSSFMACASSPHATDTMHAFRNSQFVIRNSLSCYRTMPRVNLGNIGTRRRPPVPARVQRRQGGGWWRWRWWNSRAFACHISGILHISIGRRAESARYLSPSSRSIVPRTWHSKHRHCEPPSHLSDSPIFTLLSARQFT